MALTAQQVHEELADIMLPLAVSWAESRATHIPAEVSEGARRAVDSIFLQVDLRDRELHDHDPATGRLRVLSAEEIRRGLVEYCIRWAREHRVSLLPVSPVAEARRKRLAELRPRYAEMRQQKEAEWRAKEEGVRREIAERREQELVQLRQLDELREQEAEKLRVQQLEQERYRLEAEAARARAEQAERDRLEAERRHREEAERLEWLRSRPAPPPPPQLYGVSDHGAEQLVCDWMRHLGVLDATVTRVQGDGGIDVDSEGFLAQVKNYTGSVPVTEVRDLGGVAAAESKRALLFTSGSLTRDGLAFAERVRIAVLRYDAVAGTLVGLNELGVRCADVGIPDAFASMD